MNDVTPPAVQHAKPATRPPPPRPSQLRHLFVRAVYLAVDLVVLLPLLLLTVASRFVRRPIDVGLGPLPTINSRHHKKCLQRYGYSCETFVYDTWHFTQDFDVRFNKWAPRSLGPYLSYVYALFRYKCIYAYFTGGPLGFTTLLARLEPHLLRLAGIKTVIMPFGSDVHELTRTTNRLMVHGYARNYPYFRLWRTRTARMIDVWTTGADHIISGCDWVEYTYYWDTLMLAHFAIDPDTYPLAERHGDPALPCTPLRLVHAPNHRSLKGTDHLLRAVDELRQEGLQIDLTVLEGLPNTEVLHLIRSADVVVDQLVIGWYAMFALEAMVCGKPVVCHIREEFRDLYIATDLLAPGELPLIEATVHTIKGTLRRLASLPRHEIWSIGDRSRAFIEKHHSSTAVGAIFDQINRNLGVPPSMADAAHDAGSDR